MKQLILALALTLGVPSTGMAQAVQHGAQPNPQEVRPGSPQGDSPSATVGSLERDPVERRILGLPATAPFVVVGVLIVLLVVGGILIPRARRQGRARGGGTY